MIKKPARCRKNLLGDTLKWLLAFNKKEADILWVGTIEEKMSWAEFKERADFYYDSGFGAKEIRRDLIIVGTDWWLERGGCEYEDWWGHASFPVKPEIHNSELMLTTTDVI